VIAGTLTFGGDVLLGTITNLYGFAVAEAERRLTLPDFVRASLARASRLPESGFRSSPESE
jgi:hypothetical protein